MIVFWILGILLIASAVFVVTQVKPVHSVVGLLFHFSILAIFYITLNAEFLAVIQIVVYSGAILILFVFVIALLSSGTSPFAAGPNKMPKAAVPAALVAFATLGLLIYGIARTQPVAHGIAAGGTSLSGPPGTANVFGSVADFGKALFTTHLLPFEMTAFILMVAVIGVVALAGETAPFVPSRRRARLVAPQERESIVGSGESK